MSHTYRNIIFMSLNANDVILDSRYSVNVYNFPIQYAFYVANIVLIFITAVSILGFLLISWHLKRRARDVVLLEHTLKIAELEHRLAALNSAPKITEKAEKANAP